MSNISHLPQYRILNEYKTDKYYQITITVSASLWKQLQSKGHLGQFYGVDISNMVHRKHPDVYAYCPAVNDRSNARNGFKVITLAYGLMSDRTSYRNIEG